MRLFYALLMYFLSPLVLAWFGIRGFRDKRYWQRWGERLGFYARPAPAGCVWVHAASLGEVNAASPLVNALLEHYPGQALLLTTFTPTGAARAEHLFSGRLTHCHVPLDLPGAVRRFYRRHQPQLGIIMETEIWPTLYHRARHSGVPLLISNARLSESSVRGYALAGRLIGPTMAGVSGVFAQTQRDAAAFMEIGARQECVQVVGNLKFDILVPASLSETGEMMRASWGVNRPVLVAGSTHAEDESELFEAFKQVLVEHPQALLVVAPRHPERFAAVAEEARELGLAVAQRSACTVPAPATQVLVVDTMGELLGFYAAADLAFVGGTLAPVGGHNLLEPAALAKPLLVGPYTANVREIADQLLAAGAARRVHDRHDLAVTIKQLFSDASGRDRMGQAGQQLVSAGRGALQRTLDALQAWLPGAPRA
jgi:3-deoxy-D-manno-octulosonic-acid transferase